MLLDSQARNCSALSSNDNTDQVSPWLEEVTAEEEQALQDHGRQHKEAWGGTFHVSDMSLKRFLTHHLVISIRPMLPIFCLWKAACLRRIRNIFSPEAFLFSPLCHFLRLVLRALHKLYLNYLCRISSHCSIPQTG